MDSENVRQSYLLESDYYYNLLYMYINHSLYIDIIYPLEFRPFVRVGKKKFRM